MTDTITHDATRSLLEITGHDAESFLQGIITQDVTGMSQGETRFSALLSPQGKWQFDFFITRTQTGFWLDTLAETLPRLIQGFTLYKLRADVVLNELDNQRLYYINTDQETSNATADPRHSALPKRLWQTASQPIPEGAVCVQDYHATRLQHGIPEGRTDVTPQETAMDAGYDCLRGIHFEKGCYVGQEVTARMHYKAIARKGFYMVKLAEPNATLTLPATITAAGKPVAELRSAQGQYGLAFAKFDAVHKAQTQATPLLLGDTPVTLSIPDWLTPKYQIFESTLSA